MGLIILLLSTCQIVTGLFTLIAWMDKDIQRATFHLLLYVALNGLTMRFVDFVETRKAAAK